MDELIQGGAPPAREQRYVFGEVADLYDRARPGYPEALFDDVIAFVGLEAPRVLEVGAGTGKATVGFAARGLEIVALEPTREMAAVAARNCAAFPAVTIEPAGFETWSGTGFDVLVAAQSWHWVPPEMRCARAHAALAPNGVLALFWNVPMWDDGELLAELDAAHRRWDADGRAHGFPALHGRAGRGYVDDVEASDLFGPLERRTYSRDVRYTTNQYLDLLRTHSDHRMLPEADREHLLEDVGRLLDARGGAFSLRYETWLFLSRALPET